MDAHILLTKDVDISKLTFGNMKALDNGVTRMVYLNYGGNPLILQTPELTAPFGIGSYSNEDAGAMIKYSIDLAFRNQATRPVEAAFLAVLNAFDQRVKENVLENSAAYLKKKYSNIEVVEALYTPSVRLPKDKMTGEVTDKYPPTFKLTVPSKDGAFACSAYDLDDNVLDIAALYKDGVTKGSKITAIIQCSSIWIAGGKFGCTWKVLQMRVKTSDALPPCAFTDERSSTKCDDDDDGEFAPRAASAAAAAAVVAPPATVAEETKAEPMDVDDKVVDAVTDEGGKTEAMDEVKADDDAKTPTKKKVVAKKK